MSHLSQFGESNHLFVVAGRSIASDNLNALSAMTVEAQNSDGIRSILMVFQISADLNNGISDTNGAVDLNRHAVFSQVIGELLWPFAVVVELVVHDEDIAAAAHFGFPSFSRI
jgi:hypothetical protein